MLDVVKIFLPAALAFFIGLAITPVLTNLFYKYKMWKRYSRAETTIEEFQKIHLSKKEATTPRPGGSIIWLSVLITMMIFVVLAWLFPSELSNKLTFLSRNQTLLPLFALVVGALVGLVDDFIQIFGRNRFAKDDVIFRNFKIGIIIVLGAAIGWWFQAKLGMNSISIPFDGYLYLGAFFIPAFILVMLAVFSSSVIDGIDGLSGGVLASIFAAYAVIAFSNNQIDLAAFCAVILGALLAFLWFNIPPARFYMGETGMIALTATIATIAFLTDTVLILPIIALPLVLTTLSVIIQLLSKKLRGGKRVFKVAPIHHHFEALGWPSYKVTMRFWVLSIVFAIVGMIIALIS